MSNYKHTYVKQAHKYDHVIIKVLLNDQLNSTSLSKVTRSMQYLHNRTDEYFFFIVIYDHNFKQLF